MKTETYKAYNPNATRVVNPKQIIERVLNNTEHMLVFVANKKSNLLDDYVTAIQKRLKANVGDFQFDIEKFDLTEIKENLSLVNNYPGLLELSTLFSCKLLGLPIDYPPNTEKIEVLSLNFARASYLQKYHRIKAFADLLGNDEGIQLYKDYVDYKFQERSQSEKNPRTAKQCREDQLKEFTELEAYNWTFAIFDDERYLLKVDTCVYHEALKSLNDPEFCYLTMCYSGSFAIKNDNEYVRMRRTQTLFEGDFCDEFYWNREVHEEPEQPSLEFSRKLGKE